MANTPNINLVKPLGTDKALVSVLNDNSDKIDSFAGSTNTNIGKVEAGMAIVVNGNTAPKAITAGQYLFIKNHSTLSAGGYHATASIASGATISSSNVAADADGVVNGAFSALNSKIANKQDIIQLGSISGSNGKERIINAFNAMPGNDKPVTGSFSASGQWMFNGIKYSGGDYGFMVAEFYNSQGIYILNVNNGVKTVRYITGNEI